ncbi:copper-binding protein [Burkholderia sp. Ac-20379]|uniref:copper-binding protein n=1 Tax=Burkholderia sp. Ac-20379 TaxID=2703900 RepID=UPI00197F5919|nr:copper-binding protein [Burkholderia sp. Ac-20379]MBN3724209.1 copper-binding protein [Burkholderia sp. Ac-20379]
MNTLYARSALLFAAIAGLAAAPAFAGDMAGMTMTAPAGAQADDGLTDAVVRKVDPATGMITLKHGTLANIGMPAMTMAYKAGTADMAQHVHAGDKVRVRVENLNGTLTIVKLDDPS